MKIAIKIQSIVDVITNSSTEVFVSSTTSTIYYAEQLLARMLGIKVSELEDRFDISLDDLYSGTELIMTSKTNSPEDLEAIELIKGLLDSIVYNS